MKNIRAVPLAIAVMVCVVLTFTMSVPNSAKAEGSFDQFKEHRDNTQRYWLRVYSVATKLVSKGALNSSEREICTTALSEADKAFSTAIGHDDLTKVDRALDPCAKALDGVLARMKANRQ